MDLMKYANVIEIIGTEDDDESENECATGFI